MWSLERGVSCTAERGSGRIRSGRICTLACLILSRETKRDNDIGHGKKNTDEEGNVNESKRRRVKRSRGKTNETNGVLAECQQVYDRMFVNLR